MSIADQPEFSPEQLAARSQGGCLESFEQLVSRFQLPIFNFLFQFTRNRHDAEDLTQETFLKAWRGLAGYKPALAFAPWLFTIARRTAINHYRSFKPTEELPAHVEATGEDPAQQLEDKEEQSGIWRLARTLKPKQSEVLWLFYGQGFSIAETARVMGAHPIHVRVLLHRARANLSKIMETTAPHLNRAAGQKAAAGTVRIAEE